MQFISFSNSRTKSIIYPGGEGVGGGGGGISWSNRNCVYWHTLLGNEKKKFCKNIYTLVYGFVKAYSMPVYIRQKVKNIIV